jgi:hypothetical protein
VFYLILYGRIQASRIIKYIHICIVFNFVSAFEVREINVKYVIRVYANRGDQNSAVVRVCFIRVYVFASAARLTQFFLFSCKPDVFLFIDDQFFDINLK